MLPIMDDARLQVAAATSLLECSRLVHWRADVTKFIPVSKDDFEAAWKEIHPVFGRLICWICFSAGAELLAKGVCLAREVEIRKPEKKPVCPAKGDNLDSWAPQFLQNSSYAGTEELPNFGTLADLYRDNKKQKAALKRLCCVVKASQQEEQRLLAAYILLAKSIRNRDAHAYIQEARGQHFLSFQNSSPKYST